MNRDLKKIYKVYQSAQRVFFDKHSNIVLMSDCHRGTGSLGDDFYKNKEIYLHALNYYFNRNFTYIEIGDGDELWENDCFSDILHTHRESFDVLSKFYKDNRLYFIYGNHDMIKKHTRFLKKNFYPIFGKIDVHEAIVLNQKETNHELLLLHGHQLDFLNNELWKVSKFLVRYLWGPLQLLGVISPANTSLSFCRKKTIDIKFMDWCTNENKALAAGHTHNYIFPEAGTVPYFNTGSCIYPQGITCLEIENGYVKLVAWHSKTLKGVKLFKKELIGGPVKFENYFSIAKLKKT